MRVREPLIAYHTAPNGLRMVCLHRPGTAVGFAGIDVHVGSRDEAISEHGLAHFVEHTIFKGTKRRSSWHIINRMESVGGELNAYTTKEETVVYTAFPGGNPTRAADLVADLAVNSCFPTVQLEKEREVVADEIDSYLDTPSDAVFDDFEDELFAGSDLGHNILGTEESLRTFNSDTCRSYLSRWYTASDMIVFYAGPMRPDRVFSIFEHAFTDLPTEAFPRPQSSVPVNEPFDIVRPIGSHQSHTIMGARTPGFSDSGRFALGLFTNIIGGPGMNSLLNMELREKRGLVYNVEASTGLFSDCGALTIYYGCDPDDDEMCRRIVTETVERVADGAINARNLERAKKQYLGQMVVGAENMENRILGIARRTLFNGHASTSRDTIEAIRSISAADIAATATAMLPLSRLTLT